MAGDHEQHVGHVVPLKVLAGIWFALLVLTVVTVAVARVDLKELNILVALGIATFKASLVGLYFMHLRYDRPFNAVILVCSLVFVALFISLALMDSFEYQELIRSYETANPPSAAAP